MAITNSILIDTNRQIRQSRPLINDANACEIYQTDSVLEISLSRGRCVNDKKGACIMCDYGIASKDKPVHEYLQEMEQAIKACSDTVQCLMLCTNGSIFDENQVEDELLEGAIDLASQCSISKIQFESHYLDVSSQKLKMIKEKLTGKKVIIALGFETANQEYQDLIIGKQIKITIFEEKIALIKSFGFSIELNIMLGLPFLSPHEQFVDSLSTLKWAYSHQCRPVLFPINIKPYTLLMEMYNTNYYHPISHWLILLLLEQLTEKELSQIILVWKGDRIENYDAPAVQQILPASCEKCFSAIEHFYAEFDKTDSGNKRKRILNDILHKSSCDCLCKVRDGINHESSLGFYDNYIRYINFLKTQAKGRDFHE